MALVYMAPGIAGDFILPLQLAFVVFYFTAGKRLFSQGSKQSHLGISAIGTEHQSIGK
jgi:hypothetical protein